MTIQPRNTPAPAPVAPLPSRDPGCRGPISTPSRSVPFSAPIDTHDRMLLDVLLISLSVGKS